jgi:hypothetical protein
MIPQIAHHPRNLSQQFGNHGFVAPPFEPLQPPRIPDRLAPLPFRSSRTLPSSSTLAPPHRAYPVESHASHRSGSSGSGPADQGFGRQYHDPAEHMLRRKTPNGTLAAGYDGTPVQWSSKAPALKHVLLPMSASSSAQHAAPLGKVPDEQRARQRSNSLGWNYNPTSSHFGSVNSAGGDLRIHSDPMNWTNVPPLSFTQHNVLDHLSMQQQAATYYPNNGMQIPTVLQPAYQPSPGPTASNGGGFYGPYWPDGKFVPYRPAAFRDQGHHYSNYEIDMNRGFQHQQSNSPAEFLPLFRQSSFNVDSAQLTGRPPFALSDNVPQMHDTGFITPQQSQQIYDGVSIYSSFADGARTPTAQSVSRASNTQFKEKTLSWAHSIYVDLLAFLHQSKKENRQARQSNGFRPYSKNSIYPKPPRQPTSHLGNSHWTESYPKSAVRESSGPRRHVSALLSNSHRTNSFSGWQSNGDFVEARHTRFSNQEVPHYVSPFQIPNPSPSSPLSKAKEALEMLTTLCEQSGWFWVDGMLLGGCLAYGLEEYHKALEWYSKILALDPK